MVRKGRVTFTVPSPLPPEADRLIADGHAVLHDHSLPIRVDGYGARCVHCGQEAGPRWRVCELRGVGQLHVPAADELDGEMLRVASAGQADRRQAPGAGARRQRRDVGPRGIQVEGPFRQIVCAVLVVVLSWSVDRGAEVLQFPRIGQAVVVFVLRSAFLSFIVATRSKSPPQPAGRFFWHFAEAAPSWNRHAVIGVQCKHLLQGFAARQNVVLRFFRTPAGRMGAMERASTNPPGLRRLRRASIPARACRDAPHSAVQVRSDSYHLL